MKKVYYILALTATLITGCSQNEELSMIETPNGNENTVGKNSLTATFDGGTRTMSPDGKTTKWVDHDQIYVYGSDGTVTYTTSQGGGTTAIFTCSGSAISNMKYAVYGPTSSTPSFSNEGKTVTGITIPTNWTYSTNNNCANCIMMGEINTTNYTVAFKNAGAILYITLGNNITIAENTNLTVTTASTPISGEANVNWNDGNPTYSCTGEGKTITITGLSGISEEKKIIIPMPVISTAEKIEVKLGEKLIFSESATLERNKYYCIDYTTDGVQTVFSEVGLTDALTAGNSVALGKDITIDYVLEGYSLSSNAVIDLNGHTLTANKIKTNTHNLEITGASTGSALATNIESNANLTLTNVNLAGNITSVGNYSLTNVNLTGNISSTGGENSLTSVILSGSITSTGGKNTLTDVTINNNDNDYGISATAESYPADATTAPKYTISNCKINAKNTAVYLKYTDLEISSSSLHVSAQQPENANGTGYCIAVMGGDVVASNPAKGTIKLGKDGNPNTYSVANSSSNNVYIFANEEPHEGLTLNISNDTNAKITWQTPKATTE